MILIKFLLLMHLQCNLEIFSCETKSKIVFVICIFCSNHMWICDHVLVKLYVNLIINVRFAINVLVM